MKGANTHISKKLLGLFLGKELHQYKVDVAREVAATASAQMKQVVTKQKLVKCCHVWYALYKQALTEGRGTATSTLLAKVLPRPVKTSSTSSQGSKKRKERTNPFGSPSDGLVIKSLVLAKAPQLDQEVSSAIVPQAALEAQRPLLLVYC